MVDDAPDADAKSALRNRLGDLPSINRLSADQARTLSEAVRRVHRRHAEQLSAAADESLEHIPALLRSSVRRVLGL